MGIDVYNMAETGDKTMSITGAATDAHHIPCVTYQKTTGALTPGAHPGSYNGQDAYNDMLVVGGTEQTVSALCARDYKGVGSQYVSENKCIVQYSRPSDPEI